ncbi:hypothetical protein PFISCL1PPCAC_21272, partial [Pristionchus fissidentatus]
IKNQRPTDSWRRPVAGSIKPLAAPAAAPVAPAAAYCRPHGFVGEPTKASAAAAAASFNGFKSAVGSKGGVTAATAFKGFGTGKPANGAAPTARPSQQHSRPDDDKDYSPEAIEGRSCERVQYSDRHQQRKTRGVPEPDCPSRRAFVPEQTRWHAQGIRACEVCGEWITSNEKADQTVKELNGTGLYGEKITVARSKYWFKHPHAVARKTINSAPRSITALQDSLSNLNMKNEWEENNENDSDDDEIDESGSDSEECEE